MKGLGLLLAGLLGLAACGSDPAGIDDLGLIKQVIVQKLAARGKAAAPAPISRAELDAIGLPLIRVKVLKRSAVAVLGLVGTNNGVQTWTSVDSLTIGLRDGMVLATRGFGDDLISATVPLASEIAHGSGQVEHRLFTLEGADREIRRIVACSLTTTGTEVIEVVQLRYSARHVIETCAGEGLRFQNQYWFENSGNLRQSVQWISAEVGYLEIQDANR